MSLGIYGFRGLGLQGFRGSEVQWFRVNSWLGISVFSRGPWERHLVSQVSKASAFGVWVTPTGTIPQTGGVWDVRIPCARPPHTFLATQLELSQANNCMLIVGSCFLHNRKVE